MKEKQERGVADSGDAIFWQRSAFAGFKNYCWYMVHDVVWDLNKAPTLHVVGELAAWPLMSLFRRINNQKSTYRIDATHRQKTKEREAKTFTSLGRWVGIIFFALLSIPTFLISVIFKSLAFISEPTREAIRETRQAVSEQDARENKNEEAHQEAEQERRLGIARAKSEASKKQAEEKADLEQREKKLAKAIETLKQDQSAREEAIEKMRIHAEQVAKQRRDAILTLKKRAVQVGSSDLEEGLELAKKRIDKLEDGGVQRETDMRELFQSGEKNLAEAAAREEELHAQITNLQAQALATMQASAFREAAAQKNNQGLKLQLLEARIARAEARVAQGEAQKENKSLWEFMGIDTEIDADAKNDTSLSSADRIARAARIVYQREHEREQEEIAAQEGRVQRPLLGAKGLNKP